MEGSDQEVEEISPPVLNRTTHKKYRQKILLEPLRPYFLPSQQEKNSQTPDD
jgi:hypothetical protein